MIDVLEEIISVEEYLELEKTSLVKHEYVEGILIEIPGETKIANEVSGNLYAKLRTLRKSGYRIFDHDVKLEIPSKDKYRYPDVMVGFKNDDENEYFVTKPVLLAEIVSDSSRETDYHTKLLEYTTIPTLQYYLIIEQDTCMIEMYRRNGSIWEFLVFVNINDTIELSYFDLKISLSEIYEEVKGI